ncbi:MAG: transglutaminase TgpA family protein [Myxococcota bacterium]
MRFDRLHKTVAYLGAGLGLWALSFGGEIDGGLLVLIAVAFAASWFVEGPLLERPGYARFWNGLVVAVLLVQVARVVLGASWLGAGIEYAAFLQLSRLSHRRSAREYQHIAVLAFLHLIAGTVLTTGLGYAFVFLGFVVVTPWMLALTHLRAEIEEHYAHARDDTDHLDRFLGSKRLAGPGFLLGTALLAVPLFLVTAGLFLLFPRVGMGFLSFRTDTGQSVAGFGRNVELGRFGVIRDDPTVIMRVKAHDGDATPPSFDLRMRGTSFDHYDGRRWTRTPLPDDVLPRMFDRYAIVRWPRPTDMELEIVLDRLDEPVVFLPEGTVALSIPPRVRGGQEVGRTLVRSEGLDVRYRDADGLGLVYAAHVARDGRSPIEPLDSDARERYLQIPDDHDEVVRLARRVTDGAVTADARVRRILAHLRASGTYDYTLEQPPVGDAPPLEAFLFDNRRGHCEYFSSAMAIMLRAVGIPARNVTGFAGGRYNRFGGYYAIRQGDAHSWVEAYVDGRWVAQDPTPPARGDIRPDEGPLDGVRALFDALRTRWSTHIVDYDLRDQASGFRRAMRWLGLGFRHDAADDGSHAQDSAARESVPRRIGDRVWIGLLALLAAAGLIWLGRRLRRPSAPPADRAVRLYHLLDHRMRKAGRPRSPSVTPLAHLRRLEAEDAPGTPIAREVTEAYLAARYAGKPLDARTTRRLRRALRAWPRDRGSRRPRGTGGSISAG